MANIDIRDSSSEAESGKSKTEETVSSTQETQPVEPDATAPEVPEEAETSSEANDDAVDDILKHDGDDALKAQDTAAEKPVVMGKNHWERFKDGWSAWWANPKKRYGTIGAIVLVLALLFAVPFTRYSLLGLVLKSDVTVNAIDSKTGAAVSGATVTLGGKTAQTDANGKAMLHVHLGNKSLVVSKKYYAGSSSKALVTLSSSHNQFRARLAAQGRQVQIKLVNKVSGKPLSSASIDIQGAKTKTNASGLATVIIPADSSEQKASVSFNGFNTLTVTVQPDAALTKNTFALTPAGKLYFLSNLSGKIDVVKTNLDGTDRQTVLAGTGNEDAQSTSLLASRDWKYLALLSKRSGDNATIYLIDTTNNDKLTTVDQGDAVYSFVGWSGDNFVYQVSRNTVQNWQANQQVLKSLNAASGQTLILDQTQGTGNTDTDYVRQRFGSVYLLDDQVVYIKNWEAGYYNWNQLGGKQAELDSIGSNGSGHKTVKTFTNADGVYTSQVYVDAKLYEPKGMYLNFNDGHTSSFFAYEDGKLTSDTTLTETKYYQTPYPTYLQSPSGSQTFWAEQRDGKNTLFTGDDEGGSQKQIASLSDYNTYGWFTDNYLLVSKNSSELYIMPATGGTPLKITDYYKPAINYQGYGGGYGGL